MIVVAVDPGETTGYAAYDTKTEELVASGELFGSFRGCIDHVLSLGDFFIVEDFRVRPGKGAALAQHARLWPVEWLGVFRYKLHPDRWMTQTPSQRNSASRPLPAEPASPHELDALLHLQYWLDRQRPASLARAILSCYSPTT